jgi:hypothetical protein
MKTNFLTTKRQTQEFTYILQVYFFIFNHILTEITLPTSKDHYSKNTNELPTQEPNKMH